MGVNGDPSMSKACAVHSEQKLINCVNNIHDTRRQARQLFFMSSQCKALNNFRSSVIHRHCCLNGSVSMPCTVVVTPTSGTVASAPDSRLQLSHCLHQVTKQIVCSTDVEIQPDQDT